jgi:hypothetical protein
MKSILDQSHCTVLSNLETFQRARQCVDEIKSFVWDVLRELADELPESDDPPVKFSLTREGEDGYLQANTLQNWQDTGFELVSIGVENFDLPHLIGSDGAQGCRAFIYSVLLSDSKRATEYAAVGDRLRQLRPPLGYVPPSMLPPGYIFVKKLDALPPESVCSRTKLKSHFAEPILELIAWLKANYVAISALGQKSATVDEPAKPSAASFAE